MTRAPSLRLALLDAVALLALVSPTPPAQARSERSEVLRAVKAHKGISLNELARVLPMSWRRLYDRLDELEEKGSIVIETAGRQRLVFAASAKVNDARKAVATISEAAKDIARFIADHPGCGMKDILDAMPVRERTTYHHVRWLIDEGLVTTGSKKRYVALKVTPELRRALR